MEDIDLSAADLDGIDALLDREGLDDRTKIRAMERLAAINAYNYIEGYIQRKGHSDEVLLKGAQLLVDEGRFLDIAEMMRNGVPSEGAREQAAEMFISAMAKADPMHLLSDIFGIHRLIRSGDTRMRDMVIEGIAENGGSLLMGELIDYLRKGRPDDALASRMTGILLEKGQGDTLQQLLDRELLKGNVKEIVKEALQKNPLQRDGMRSEGKPGRESPEGPGKRRVRT